MDVIIFRTVGLLAAAMIVAIVARRIRLPYTVGLVIAGAGLAAARVQTGLELTHDFIFDVILPPLLFEAALCIHWKELRRDALPVLTLATLGVVIAALVVAFSATALLGWPFASALVFGVLIAATDPVAVIAMFKDTGVKGRLRLLVESESLLNDGVAAVLFALVVGLAQATGESSSLPQALGALAVTAGGATLIGLAVGGVCILIAGRTPDHLVETGLTIIAAYGSFLLAEHIHVSGVLATVAAGMLMGNLGLLDSRKANRLALDGGEFVVAFWDFAAFIANSLIFLLIGVTLAAIPFTGLGPAALLLIVVLVLMGRALTVYPLCLIFARSRWAIPVREQHLLWWGGLRGALALALALALPQALAMRNEILVATFGVVAFSVVVQGLTMAPFLKMLGLLPERS
jgi:CPA1 family monovalent cation:H+ antiporter